MDGNGKLDTFLLPLSDANIANIYLSAECPGSLACSNFSMLLMDSRWTEVRVTWKQIKSKIDLI